MTHPILVSIHNDDDGRPLGRLYPFEAGAPVPNLGEVLILTEDDPAQRVVVTRREFHYNVQGGELTSEVALFVQPSHLQPPD